MSATQRFLACGLVVLSTSFGLPTSAAEPMLTGGMAHALYLADDGTVWAWGNNTYGQLGANPSVVSSSLQPQKIAGLSNIVAISAGFYHSLALTADGQVYAWGFNIHGQLGNGTTGIDKWQPGWVQGLPAKGIKAIAAGGYHGLALDASGHVWGWGYNGTGILGIGNTVNAQTFALPVTTSSHIRAIAAGYLHNLALTDSGTVLGWGYNSNGQVGDGSTTTRNSPVPVSGLSNIMNISAGTYHSAAVTASGTAYLWGANDYGQLGNGTYNDSTTPGTVGAAVVSRVLAFGNSTLVLRSNSYISLFGDNAYGQCLQSKTTATITTPYNPGTSLRNGMASGFGQFNLAIDNNGNVLACGLNTYGTFGIDSDTPSDSSTWRTVKANWPVSHIVATAAGQYHSAALKSDGTVWSWGYNANGQVGDGTVTSQLTPVQSVGVSYVQALSAGSDYGDHTLALRSYGQVYAWGRNEYGQLGNGTTTTPCTTPALVSGSISSIRAVAAGDYHSLALEYTGTIKSWGSDSYGQLGDNAALSDSSSPVTVTNLGNIVAVSGGTRHSMALRTDGTVWTWGNGSLGQLGNGTFTSTQGTPVQASGITGVVAIAAGSYHSLALKADGSVWAWGQNSNGQLGIDNTTTKNAPIQVLSPLGGTNTLADIRAIGAGRNLSYAVDGNGHIYAWGYNNVGQLGNGSNTDSSLPVKTGLDNVCSLEGGYVHALATLADGTVADWGGNSSNQLGNGSDSPALFPTSPVATWLPYVSIDLASSTLTANETNTNPASIRVIRTGLYGSSTSVAGTVPVNVAVAASSTARPQDYTLSSLSIPAGQTSATLTVTPHHNSIAEDDTLVTPTLQADPANYNLAACTAGVVTIVNSDVAGITLSPGTVTVHESNGVPPAIGTGTTMTVTIHLQSDPVSNVVLTVANNQPDRCMVSPTQVTLSGGTSGSWQSGVSFNVTATNDYVAGGDRPFTLTVHVSPSSTDWQGKYRLLPDQYLGGLCLDDLSGSVCTPLGTPVAWLTVYSLTNAAPRSAETNDHDGDGMLAWQEYIAGTDPTNAASVLRVMKVAADSVTFTPAFSNRTYAVLCTTGLTTRAADWQPLAPYQTATGTISILPGGNVSTQLFYRIGVRY